jgi:hypothetical protein
MPASILQVSVEDGGDEPSEGTAPFSHFDYMVEELAREGLVEIDQSLYFGRKCVLRHVVVIS